MFAYQTDASTLFKDNFSSFSKSFTNSGKSRIDKNFKQSCSRSRSAEKEECLSKFKTLKVAPSTRDLNLRRDKNQDNKEFQTKGEIVTRQKYSQKPSYGSSDYNSRFQEKTTSFGLNQSKLGRYASFLEKSQKSDKRIDKSPSTSKDRDRLRKSFSDISKQNCNSSQSQEQNLLDDREIASKQSGLNRTNLKKNNRLFCHFQKDDSKKEEDKGSNENLDNEMDEVKILIDPNEGFDDQFLQEASGINQITNNNALKSSLSNEINNNGEIKCSSITFSTSTVPLATNQNIRDPRKVFLPNTHINDSDKLNLVLDLDETLINSYTISKTFNTKCLNKLNQNSVFEFNCGENRVIMVLRPYLFEFLERTSKYFNLYMYSHGRYEYVSCALDMIDKEKKYFKRERVFKNKESKNIGLKVLQNLIPDLKEREKTLIIDDYCHIWAEETQVISSKKFIPLKNLMKQEKYNKYPLLKLEEPKDKKSSKIRWLSHNNNVSDLKSYSEGWLNDQKTPQLEALADFLEHMAEQYKLNRVFYPMGHEKLNLGKIYQEKRKSILQGWKVSVISGCPQRQKTFEELSEILGAENKGIKEAQYLLIDAYLDGLTKIKLQHHLIENPRAKIISIYWLIECFFLLKQVSIQDFYTNSSQR